MSRPNPKFFAFAHLKPEMQVVSKPFGELAQRVLETLPDCEERDVALRKLLEAKDAAVRALIDEPRQAEKIPDARPTAPG